MLYLCSNVQCAHKYEPLHILVLIICENYILAPAIISHPMYKCTCYNTYVHAEVLVSCAAEPDATWGIDWPFTRAGDTAVVSCGANFTGKFNTGSVLYVHTYIHCTYQCSFFSVSMCSSFIHVHPCVRDHNVVHMYIHYIINRYAVHTYYDVLKRAMWEDYTHRVISPSHTRETIPPTNIFPHSHTHYIII